MKTLDVVREWIDGIGLDMRGGERKADRFRSSECASDFKEFDEELYCARALDRVIPIGLAKPIGITRSRARAQ